MSVDSTAIGAWIGGIGCLIIGGWILSTYFENTTENRVPLRVQHLESKIRGALPKELAPGVRWFDIDIGRSTLGFSIKLGNTNAKNFEQSGSLEALKNFTNAFVCEWRSRNMPNVDVIVVVKYYGSKNKLINSVRNNNASCKKQKRIPKLSL